MEARGGRPLPPQSHRCAAVGDGGAVRAADQWPEGSSRHVEPQPAQPVEGHGGRLPEAQREPGRQPRLQSPAHRVLKPALLSFPSLPVSVPNLTCRGRPFSHLPLPSPFDYRLLKRHVPNVCPGSGGNNFKFEFKRNPTRSTANRIC